MRPSHTIPGAGSLREITLWKAFVLGILTLGIYILVLVYQNSKDIHAAADRDDTWVIVLFITGILFLIPMLVLYALNGVALNDVRERKGRRRDGTWIVALVLLVLPIVGEVVWAVHFNNSLRGLAQRP